MTGGQSQEWRILQAIVEEIRQNMFKEKQNAEED
jgi:hypothetical protein